MASYNVKVYYYDTETQYRVYEKPITTKEKLSDISEEEKLNAKKKQKKKHLRYIEFDDGTSFIGEQLDETFDIQRAINVSINRSKQNLIGILRANSWEYFVTFTFNPRLVSSDNYYEVCKSASRYMNNLRQNYCSDLKYVLVPELHKDGEHYHLHGVISNTKGMKFLPSGKFDKKGNVIYNIPSWKYGWNTATEVEHTGKVSNYISKYITKDTEGLLRGKRRYWASHNCILREECCDTFLVEDPQEVINFLSKNNAIKHIKSAYVPQTNNNIYYIET